MNIRCPHCQTVFRVNPDRIPASGVRAKCARCGDTFLVTPPPAGAPRDAMSARAAVPQSREAVSTRAPPPPPPSAGTRPPRGPAESVGRPAVAPPAAASPAGAVSAEVAQAAGAASVASPQPGDARAPDARATTGGVAAPSPAPAPGPSPAQAASAATGSAETTRGASFGAKDPRAKAERLARALVSDIVAYHPERREQSLTSGSLRTEFRDEIMKSWEEYVAQVGIEVAKSTPYFRDALNNILAKGQRIF